MTERQATGFRENLTVSFYFWPIACSIAVKTVTSEIRGDNKLFTHSTNATTLLNTTSPYLRAFPTSPLERNWVSVIDSIYNAEADHFGDGTSAGQYAPARWLEDRLLAHVNDTTSSLTTSQKIAAVELELESITSIAYSLLFEQVYSNKSSTGYARSNVTLPGQARLTMAKLQVHGLQVIIGFICVVLLTVCTLVASHAPLEATRAQDENMLSGEVIDFLCLMKGSSLPELLNDKDHTTTDTDARRRRAENIDVLCVHFATPSAPGI